LARRVGSPGNLGEWSAALASGAAVVVDAASLRDFLSTYLSLSLIPVELPLVRQSYECAVRGAVRDLIGLDRQYTPTGPAAHLSEASQGVGRAHLRRMRPLRGERRVQRYWQAVQRGEARAWHPLVYGLVLAVYGLPLRQGLVNFGMQTIRGFVHASQDRLLLDDGLRRDIELEFTKPVAPAVEQLLAGYGSPRLLAV
jgi:urease accessory protein UreF